MFVSVYLELLLVAALLKLNVELDDPRGPSAVYLCASLLISLLIGTPFFVVFFYTLVKTPFVYGYFWATKNWNPSTSPTGRSAYCFPRSS